LSVGDFALSSSSLVKIRGSFGGGSLDSVNFEAAGWLVDRLAGNANIVEVVVGSSSDSRGVRNLGGNIDVVDESGVSASSDDSGVGGTEMVARSLQSFRGAGSVASSEGSSSSVGGVGGGRNSGSVSSSGVGGGSVSGSRNSGGVNAGSLSGRESS